MANISDSPVAAFPRDAHILYQDHTRRLAEGDAVDISMLRKVEVTLQHMDREQSAARCVFLYEDHTLGNALRHVLMQHPAVRTAGYNVPHPLEPKMMLQVQTQGFAPDVVSEGMQDLATLCERLADRFDEAVSSTRVGNE